jgi:hypothetical protein
MPVNTTHAEYDGALLAWLRARDVIAGEDAVKSAGERYLPRLEAQTDEEYAAYRARAAFFNATARTADGYLGLIFRRPPFVKAGNGTHGTNGTNGSVGAGGSAVGKAMKAFVNDADMLGTSLANTERGASTGAKWKSGGPRRSAGGGAQKNGNWSRRAFRCGWGSRCR